MEYANSRKMARRYHVYQTEKNGQIKVIDSSDVNSAQEVDQMIAAKEGTKVGSVNWFGIIASTPEEAIKKAVASGFRYRSPEYMDDLKSRLQKFGL